MEVVRALHPRFGVELSGIDLRAVAESGAGFDALRAAFDAHSLLLIRNQSLDEDTHQRLAARFGPIEDRAALAGEEGPFRVPKVSNLRADGTTTGPDDLHTLNLQANMLWHTDSTFLPAPALVNILTARVVPASGGATEFASTRAAFADMDHGAQARLRNTVLWHRYSHSRARISPELARQAMFNHWPDRPWRAVWRNPATGAEAVYVASHAFAVEGMTPPEGAAFIDALIARCTQAQYVYRHEWQVGDVLLFDERATLHRGTPWDYNEPRELQSICVTATEADGLSSVRVLAA